MTTIDTLLIISPQYVEVLLEIVLSFGLVGSTMYYITTKIFYAHEIIDI